MSLRIPAWCDSPRAVLNGAEIALSGDGYAREQLINQMKKLYNVKKVQELGDDVTVKRELMLMKVKKSVRAYSRNS